MFNLENYVKALKTLLDKEKDSKKRAKIIQKWIDVLKHHHRLYEGKKLLSTVEKVWKDDFSQGVIHAANEDQARKLEKIMVKMNVQVKKEINPEIINGWKVIFNGTMVDNTLKAQLDKLHKSLQR